MNDKARTGELTMRDVLNSASPAARATDRGKAALSASAALYQSLWEAAQFFDEEKIREMVDATLSDIATDEP